MEKINNNINENYIRNCPKCEIELYYSSEITLIRAKNKNSLCYSCAKMEHTVNEKTKIKIGKSNSVKLKGKNFQKNIKIIIKKQ